MICRYSLTIKCACPVDELSDVYEAEFESAATIKVEDILEAVRPFEAGQMFQEDLTASIARTLGCKVTTTGYHSGVKTVVIAP
jgi:hypothetical protein